MIYSIYGIEERNLENLLKIIRSIESTHRGLGVPESFNILSIVANHSVFNVASSGSGKTHMIYSIVQQCQKFPNADVQNWNSMTYYELLERIGVKFNKKLIWTVEEWSMLSDYHRETLLAISSKIATDRSYERSFRAGAQTSVIKISNCDLVMLIAIQPFKFTRLMKDSDNWQSIASDRFIKFCMVNPLREKTLDFPPIFQFPDVDYYRKIETEPNPILINLFTPHLTRPRAELAVMRYQQAWCQMNGTDKFTDTDAMGFSALYYPYLELYPLMIRSFDPDKEETFYTGAFRILEYFTSPEHYGRGVSIQEMVDVFHMNNPDDESRRISQATIYRHMNILKYKGVVQQHNPEYGVYELSKPYRDYFDNYRSLWK